MLSELLNKDTINLNVECREWEEAIKKGAELLVDRGAIEERYSYAIINNFKKYGPYMVVAPGIVLSHGRPEDGVNRLSMSLITLKKPICFGNETNDPVRLIITLAAIDNNSHLLALQELMELFMSDGDIDAIINSSNVDTVLKIINKYSS